MFPSTRPSSGSAPAAVDPMYACGRFYPPAASGCFSNFLARRRDLPSSTGGGGSPGAPAAGATAGSAAAARVSAVAAAMRMRRCRASAPPARNDHHENWRMWMGGHDPAAPMAEALINIHNHQVMWMIFIVTTVMWGLKSRI